MDKTIEIVIVAMVILITATIVLFLVQDRTSSFSGFLDSQQDGARCNVWEARSDTMEGDRLHQVDEWERKYVNNRCGEYASEDSSDESSDRESQCSTISNQRNCRAFGACEWVGGECETKE